MKVVGIIFGVLLVCGLLAYIGFSVYKIIIDIRDRRKAKRQKLENVDLSHQAGFAATVSADDNTPSDDINNNSEVKKK